MSNKNKLEYEMEEPLFLRQMRAAATGRDSGPDRYIAPRNRKTHVDDDEDAPAYVMEDGAEISIEEFKKLGGNGEEEEEGGEKKDGGEGEGDGEAVTVTVKDGGEAKKVEVGVVKTTSNVADVGVTKKRKAARIVGQEEEGEEGVKDKPREKKGKGKAKKKVVKLSFGDEE